MKSQATTFAALSKNDEYKEELQGLYHHQHEQTKKKQLKQQQRQPPRFNFNSILLTLIAIIFFSLIVLAINEHYSQQILALINGNNGTKTVEQSLPASSSTSEALEKQLKEIQSNQLKIVAKLNQMGKKIDNLNQQSINIVDSEAATGQNPNNNQLRGEVVAISKELSVIKYDIATVTKTIQKDNAFTTNQLAALKELIIKNIQEQQKVPPPTSLAAAPPPPVLQIKDEREFEADFIIETPEEITEERFTIASQNFVDEKYVFNIPKKLWIFDSPKSSYMNELIYDNNHHFASKSKYDVMILNRTNYKAHLSLKVGENVQKFLTFLENKVNAKETINIRYHLPSIIKNYILLNVLNQNGGIMTNGQFAMTEDLSWINEIVRNKYVNRGTRGIKPQVIGFYSQDYSFDKIKENIKPFPGMNGVDKYVTIFPALEDYFIAAEKNTRFMTSLIAKIAKLLMNPLDFKRERGHYHLNNLKGEDMYYEYFLIAVQTVLQDKQKQIDLANIDKYRHFAFDYFGLNLINCYYAPYKLKAFWGDGQSHKAFQSLSQYPLDELEANIGPMRYIVRLTPVSEMNSYLRDTKDGKRKFIMEGSFIQKILYPTLASPFFKKNEQKKFVNSTNEPWLGLPKIIWVFWDKGLEKAGVNNQICVQNLRRMGKLSGFVVNQVNTSNVNTYLDAQTLKRINYSLNNPQLKIYPQSLGDLYRLALLAKYGGLYMDASFIALQSFEWLINIGKYPSQYIFNRFGHLPKVFMMWHPHYGSPLEWAINEKYNIKTQWHLAYENNFIAAEKGSELIKEWFELLLQLYLKPYLEVEKIFQDCMMYSHKWSTSGWHYLIPMDAIKCVIGRREAKLLKEGKKEFASASDYYKIWSISGYLGQQKLRSNTNFDQPGSEDNKFVYRYSQEYVEGLIGKVRHLFKFYSQHNKELTLFVGNHMDGDFSGEAHPDSFFMRYMWQKSFKLEEVNFYPKLKLSS